MYLMLTPKELARALKEKHNAEANAAHLRKVLRRQRNQTTRLMKRAAIEKKNGEKQ